MILARITLPAVEAIFGLATPGGLAVFANADHPLLRQLLVEAPGNYHHAQQVGHLAEAGAKALGSDRLLARVGGYLHDIGRVSGPGPCDQRRAQAAEIAATQRFPPHLARIVAEQPLDEGKSAVESTVRPQSRTSALVFLADYVEDGLGGLESTFSGEKSLKDKVRSLIRDALMRGLLDDAALELRELHVLEDAFTQALRDRFIGPISQVPRSGSHLVLN